MSPRSALVACLLFAACAPAKSPPKGEQAATAPAPDPEPTAKAPTAVPAAPTAVPTAAADPTGQDPPQLFGAPIDPAVPEVALAELIAKPDPYAGKPIRTQGTVHRVCQAAGCWMELKDDSSGQTVRAPMAGHAFFVPKDCMGKRADIQGIVELRPLTAEHKAHLEGEGATETASLLSISATGVALR